MARVTALAAAAHAAPDTNRARLRLVVLAVLLAMTSTLLPPLANTAHADAGLEAAFVTAANNARAGQGLPPLTVAGDLTTAARGHSRVMGDTSNLHHNPNLSSSVGGWQKLGENVGRGPSVDAIHRALMGSPSHRANILGSDWTQIGVGVVVVDGQIWVTQMFRQPTGSSAPAPTPPPPATEEGTGSGSAEEQPSQGTEPAREPEPSGESQGPAPEPTSPEQEEGTPTPAPGQGDDPATSEPDPTATPDLHPLVEQPLALDRTTVLLARLEAGERGLPFEELLAAFDQFDEVPAA